MKYESAGAEFDHSRIYRYRLWRMWGGRLMSWRIVLWIMLNPSTADEHQLDPTLRRCEGFTRVWGYDGFEVVNLYALRSPFPRTLYTAADPVGPGNDAAITKAVDLADLVVCGWGGDLIARDRTDVVLRMIQGHGRAHCLGTNKDGSPKHPLYQKKSTPLTLFA